MRHNHNEFSEVAIARFDAAESAAQRAAQYGRLRDSLRELVGMIGGMRRYIKATDTVFIKPNLTAGMPTETGGTTDVFFAEAVVELVREAGAARIIVGECTGNESRSIESLTNLGYKDMCERQGVEMADLDFAEFTDIAVENPKYKKTLRLPTIFWESDVFISVPVLKTHVSAGITVAIKNGFGLIPDTAKTDAHRDNAIEKVIADVCAAKPAALVFVDGRIGSEGIAGGSDFEHPIRANLIMASNDPVATDAVAARLMRQNPRVSHVRWAAEQGAGNDRPEYILIRGLSVEEAAVNYMSPADQIMRSTRGKVKIYDLGACSRCNSNAASAMHRYSYNPASLLAPVEAVTGPGEWAAPGEINPRTLLLGDCVQQKYRTCGKWIGGCPVNMGEYMKALAEFDIVCSQCERTVKKVLDDALGSGGGGESELTANAGDDESGGKASEGGGEGCGIVSDNDSKAVCDGEGGKAGSNGEGGGIANEGGCKNTRDSYADIAAALPYVRILASNKTVYQGRHNKADMDDFLFAAGKCLSSYIRNHGRRVHKYHDVDVTEYAVFAGGCPIGEDGVVAGLRELIAKMRQKGKICP